MPPASASVRGDLHRLPAPRGLLFDLDGTLVDTVGIRVPAWVQAFDELGVDVDVAALPLLMGADGHLVAREAARTRGREIDDELAEAIDHRAGEHYDTLNVEPRALPGARDLLTALARSSLPYAIATSSRAGQVRASLEALLLDTPPSIVDGSHVQHAKPAPDLLLLGARRLKVAAEDCWYVGDSIWDMQAGRAAAMTGVGVTTGFASAEQLLAAGAAAVATGLPEIQAELIRRGILPTRRPASTTGGPAATRRLAR